MREIKFRVWDKENKKMSKVGALDWDYKYNVITCNTKDTKLYKLGHEDLDFELMQYTGLKDKNGLTDIYEGDIINAKGERIGNLYENADLLENSTNFIIERMGTQAWRSSEQKAVECGCFYAK